MKVLHGLIHLRPTKGFQASKSASDQFLPEEDHPSGKRKKIDYCNLRPIYCINDSQLFTILELITSLNNKNQPKNFEKHIPTYIPHQF